MICEKEFIPTSKHKRTETNRVTCSPKCSMSYTRIRAYLWKKMNKKEFKTLSEKILDGGMYPNLDKIAVKDIKEKIQNAQRRIKKILPKFFMKPLQYEFAKKNKQNIP